MSFTLPPLPYDPDEFKNISKNAFEIHHSKHHQTYVTNLNNLTAGTEYASKSVEEIIVDTYGKSDKKSIFNNAGQHFNHSFYWKCLTPSGGAPDSSYKVAEKLKEDFESYDAFVDKFVKAGTGHFGSGWVWLVLNKSGKLEIVCTHDGECPIVDGLTPILTIDLWEHAYYLDYQNRRVNFLQDLVTGNLNWKFAEENFLKAAKI